MAENPLSYKFWKDKINMELRLKFFEKKWHFFVFFHAPVSSNHQYLLPKIPQTYRIWD